MAKLEGKKILMVIGFQGFRDDEYEIPRKILENEGAQITVASSNLGTARGKSGLQVDVDLEVREAKVSDYDALIFIGGHGAREFFYNAEAHELVRAFDEAGKVIGAICIAPMILANAGILTHRRATVFPTESHHLKNLGIFYTGADVEVDDNIVTANGPFAAEAFGQRLVEILASK